MSPRRQHPFLKTEIHPFSETCFPVERVIRESCLVISVLVDFLRRHGDLLDCGLTHETICRVKFRGPNDTMPENSLTGGGMLKADPGNACCSDGGDGKSQMSTSPAPPAFAVNRPISFAVGPATATDTGSSTISTILSQDVCDG
jgi:hypothetical protein